MRSGNRAWPTLARKHDPIEDYEHGELVCRNCGLIIHDQLLDRGPEWRAYTNEEKWRRRRVGAPISFAVYDKGLSTRITHVARDSHGRRIAAARLTEMRDLQRWQNRIRCGSSLDHNLSQAMAEIDRLTDHLRLPASIKEGAAVIYRKALEKRLNRGPTIAAVAAASLYAACRQSSVPRTLKEVASASSVRKKDVARCYRFILRTLKLRMPLVDPIRYMPKIASAADIPPPIQSRAILTVKEAKRRKVHVGMDPMGFAAAGLYLVCIREGHHVTLKSLAHAAGVSELTIRHRRRNLKHSLRPVATASERC